MAKVSAKGAVITINSQIIPDVTSYSITWQFEPLDVTCFSDGAHNFVAGMAVKEVSMDFLWDTVATVGATTVLLPLVGTNTTVSIVPESGAQGFSGTMLVVGINPSGTPADAIKLGTVRFVPPQRSHHKESRRE
jgi:hypothetical protein